MAASLAHEIRNPLSALKLNLSYLHLSQEQLDEESKESVSACLESVERINYLIETTLEFSRKSSKGLIQDSLNDIIHKAIELFEQNAKRKHVKFVMNLDKDLPLFSTNRNAALQIILNLFNNAVDACKESGIVSVKTYTTDNKSKIVLEVEDNGVGIKKEEHSKIFDDFFTSKETGTGLGLGVCKRLLEDLNAEIDFKSEENVGTCFYVTFPLRHLEE